MSLSVVAACLFMNGKTNYSIVVDVNASESEKTAALELQKYLFEISGAKFPIVHDIDFCGRCIFIGCNPKVQRMPEEITSDDDESFSYKSIGDNIVIVGGRNRGTMYGVFSFLENELGVRWYTSDYTKIPKRKKYNFSSISKVDRPAIMYRYPMYHICSFDAAWSAHNKCNFNWNAERNSYGGRVACKGVHTIGQYLSKDEYWNSHPEYFALKNGKRIKNGQRCLSNKNVLSIVIRKTLATISENQDYDYFDISQLDNNEYCECENCKAIENQYGGCHSGIILWFVNQVADEVFKRYPQRKICTLAYLYSRPAPDNIKARNNVVIRLCSNGCCRSHSIASCEENKSFRYDFQQWSKCANEIMVWDYVVNFHQYHIPFPNISTFSANIRFFQKNHAIVVLEQGQYQGEGGEFNEMKAWVLSKLLWNPEQDADSLVKEFMNDYYGKASPYVYSYYELCKKIGNVMHLKNGIQGNSAMYSDDFIHNASVILDQGLKKCHDKKHRKRVEDVYVQIKMLKALRNPVMSELNGAKKELSSYFKRQRYRVSENMSADDYLKSMDDI